MSVVTAKVFLAVKALTQNGQKQVSLGMVAKLMQQPIQRIQYGFECLIKTGMLVPQQKVGRARMNTVDQSFLRPSWVRIAEETIEHKDNAQGVIE